MHAEISAECLLASKMYSSTIKDNEQQDPEVCSLYVPCMTTLQSNTVSPNIASELWLSNNFTGNVTPKSSASLTDSILFPWSISQLQVMQHLKKTAWYTVSFSSAPQ